MFFRCQTNCILPAATKFGLGHIRYASALQLAYDFHGPIRRPVAATKGYSIQTGLDFKPDPPLTASPTRTATQILNASPSPQRPAPR
ncbi:hypothetical protein VTK56DRAFT_8389 [Thermocarpiscus australiensis]